MMPIDVISIRASDLQADGACHFFIDYSVKNASVQINFVREQLPELDPMMKLNHFCFLAARTIMPIAAASCLMASTCVGFGAAMTRLFNASAAANAKLAATATKIPDGFTIRLPHGYAAFSLPKGTASAGEELTAFRAENPDGTHPLLLILTESMDPDMQDASDKEAMVDAAIAATIPEKKQDMRHFESLPVEQGTIDGIPYKCLPYRAVEAIDGLQGTRPVSGVIYAGVENRKLVLINIEDTAPYNERSLPLEVASTLSLKRGCRPA